MFNVIKNFFKRKNEYQILMLAGIHTDLKNCNLFIYIINIHILNEYMFQ